MQYFKFSQNIAPTHKKNSTCIINSFNPLNDEDKKSKDMETDSAEKKSTNKTLTYKRNVSFVNVDTSYGDNYSTANSVTEIGKKIEVKPLINKAEYRISYSIIIHSILKYLNFLFDSQIKYLF